MPVGFESDGASIPFFARSVCPKNLANNAGVVHDYLYQQTTARNELLTKMRVSVRREVRRKFCDKLFCRLLRQVDLRLAADKPRTARFIAGLRHRIWHWVGVPMAYLAVRAFGWRYFSQGDQL